MSEQQELSNVDAHFKDHGWCIRDGVYYLCWDFSYGIRVDNEWPRYANRTLPSIDEGEEIQAMIWTGIPPVLAEHHKMWQPVTLVSVLENGKPALKTKAPYIWKV